ncbi:MAG: copper chaperone PCu(A)C [Beijerinckiaceae bacterium]
MNRRFLLLMGLAYTATLAPAIYAFGHSHMKGDLEIFHPWTFEEAKPGANVIVRMQITNSGKQADALIGVETMEAAAAALRTQSNTRPAQPVRIEIPAGKTVVLSDKGPHVALTGMRASLMASLSFPIVLVFQKAGPMRIDVVIEDR